jgi:hypothetical protein
MKCKNCKDPIHFSDIVDGEPCGLFVWRHLSGYVGCVNHWLDRHEIGRKEARDAATPEEDPYKGIKIPFTIPITIRVYRKY